MGHILNDALSSVDIFENIVDYKTFGNAYMKYCIETKEKSNCIFDYYKDVIFIKTTKEIKKGDELLLAYGVAYWATKKKLNEEQYVNYFIDWINSLKKKQFEYVKSVAFIDCLAIDLLRKTKYAKQFK